MVQPRSHALRQAVAAVLVLALTLAGVGRVLASEAPATVAGLTIPFCHAGAATPSGDPAAPSHHGCCDQCALCAPVLPPAAVALAEPVSVAHVAVHARALRWAPAVARVRTPRSSQGPPAA